MDTTVSALSRGMLDVVIVSRRGAQAVQKVLKEAAQKPEYWAQQHFIVVFDQLPTAEIDQLQKWYAENQKHLPLPHLSIYNVLGHQGKLNYLRHQGLLAGENEFVYFQHDDDPLPEGINLRLELMEQRSDYAAVYGITETLNTRHQLVESFPPTTLDGQFLYDTLAAARWFPTYLHPLAAVFRRRVLRELPMDDGYTYTVSSDGAYLVRLQHAGYKLHILPDVVRRCIHHDDNNTDTIMPPEQCSGLAADILHWQKYLQDEDIKEFQQEIARQLQRGEISTFKEIDSMVEMHLEDMMFYSAV